MNTQNDRTDTRPMEDQYKELLTNLTGVFSAKVSLDDDGNFREIHILASSSRNVKQVVRDVRSALNSYFDLDVDHRLISVAQMKENPTDYKETARLSQLAQCEPGRLRCGRISQSIEDDNYQVTITLKYHGQTFEGSASSKNSDQLRRLCVANAVLEAVHRFVGKDGLFTLITVKRIVNTPVQICMVLIEYTLEQQHCILVGATEMLQDEALSVERATLDAINRKLSALINMFSL